MSKLFLELELLSDVAISLRGATLGGHRTLKYVPGALLMGHCAAPARYASLDPAQSFRLFHSAETRFGWAFPAIGTQPALVAPMSWHRPKRGEGKIVDLTHEETRPHGYEQVREAFVADASEARPEVRYSMRTAMDEDGRAQPGLLFGIESLRAGQHFLGSVEADHDEDLEIVRRDLIGKEIRIGRSKSSEFGHVAIREVEGWTFAGDSGAVTSLRLYCMTDLCLRDRVSGAPSLASKPGDFGLPAGWKADAQRTFIRTRSYSPFNTFRRSFDLERQVIEAGSVLTFCGGPPVSLDVIRDQLDRGVGEHRQEGLGRVLVEPKLLAPPDELRSMKPSRPRISPVPDDVLGRWLGQRVARAEGFERSFEAALLAAHRFSKFDIPRAQWGEVRRMAQEAQLRGETDLRLLERVTEHVQGKSRERQPDNVQRMRGTSRLKWRLRRDGEFADELLVETIKEWSKGAVSAAAALEQLGARMARNASQESE
ncbi:MAG: hypothetical protein HY791_29355 [Deltaproteobacteria bacterium]|nr:hypothetical protein [Deltaproteobacteria bacterium]